jgi:hypothetical protein
MHGVSAERVNVRPVLWLGQEPGESCCMSAFAATSCVRAEHAAPVTSWWLPFLDSTSDAIRPFVISPGPTVARSNPCLLTFSCKNQPGIVPAVPHAFV